MESKESSTGDLNVTDFEKLQLCVTKDGGGTIISRSFKVRNEDLLSLNLNGKFRTSQTEAVMKPKVKSLAEDSCTSKPNVESFAEDSCTSKPKVESFAEDSCTSKPEVESLAEDSCTSKPEVGSLDEDEDEDSPKLLKLRMDRPLWAGQYVVRGQRISTCIKHVVNGKIIRLKPK